MNKAQLETLLHQYHLQPRREQGQNFLIDDQVIDETIAAAELSAEDTVLEIGPGFGVLTQPLAPRVKRVVAVEQDRVLTQALKKVTATARNIEIHNERIQDFYLANTGLEHEHYKLVANLPYSVTSWILQHFLEDAPAPSLAVVMVQKEVAQRVTAQPGDWSILANAVHCFAVPKIIRIVDKTSFFPSPEIDSAILKITRRPQPLSTDPAGFMRLVKIGFASKRKQLHNNLASGLQLTSTQARALLEDIGLRADARAQELSPEDWEALRRATTHKI